MKITITWRNDNPNTIWNVLARKLGRKPTNAEAIAEVKRILGEASDELLIKQAAEGKLPLQRKRFA